MTTTMNPETGTPYSRAQLIEAFQAVQNKSNWKHPIDATIAPPLSFTIDLDKLRDAVIFFTGSVPTFKKSDGWLRVKAAGYYATIGS